MSCHKHESIKSCSFFKGLGVASLVAAAAGELSEEDDEEEDAEDEEEEAPAAE